MLQEACTRSLNTISRSLRKPIKQAAPCPYQQRQRLFSSPRSALSAKTSGDRYQQPLYPSIASKRITSPRHARQLIGAPRLFTTTPARQHGHLTPPRPGEERHVTFIDKEGNEYKFTVGDGDNLLDIAQANDLEMEGACGGSCACSTCHVIVQNDEMYDKMEEPSDDENDMLDLAFGLTETSRLGCQVQMSKELDGLVVKLPSMTRNMQASDFAEKERKA